MFNKNVQGFYLDKDSGYGLPKLIMANTHRYINSGKSAFVDFLSGSPVYVSKTRNVVYMLNNINICLFKEIHDLNKEIEILNESKPSAPTRNSVASVAYSTDLKESVLTNIENNKCLVLHDDEYCNVIGLDSSNVRRKNDFLVETDNGIITICLTKGRVYLGYELSEFINLKETQRIAHENYRDELSLISAKKKIIRTKQRCLADEFYGAVLDLNDFENLKEISINQILDDKIILDETIESPIEFKEKFVEGFTGCKIFSGENIDMPTFFEFLNGVPFNEYLHFRKSMNSVRVEQTYLSDEENLLTLGLRKDRDAFSNIDSLCECIVSNTNLYERVTNFIAAKAA